MDYLDTQTLILCWLTLHMFSLFQKLRGLGTFVVLLSTLCWKICTYSEFSVSEHTTLMFRRTKKKAAKVTF